MKNQYTARALDILANHAKYMDADGEGGLYFVRVNGTLLADEDTYALRLEIEKELEKGL